MLGSISHLLCFFSVSMPWHRWWQEAKPVQCTASQPHSEHIPTRLMELIIFTTSGVCKTPRSPRECFSQDLHAPLGWSSRLKPSHRNVTHCQMAPMPWQPDSQGLNSSTAISGHTSQGTEWINTLLWYTEIKSICLQSCTHPFLSQDTFLPIQHSINLSLKAS